MLHPSDNPYLILGVQPRATIYEIRRAYRRLALTWHPDHNPDPQATDRFRKIKQAYEQLANPRQRRLLDQKLRAAAPGRPQHFGGIGPYAFNKHGIPNDPPVEYTEEVFFTRDRLFRYFIKPLVLILVACMVALAIALLSRS